MARLESWSKEHFKETMTLEGGFKGPYARTFAARIAENEKKVKGTIEERLKIELKDVTDRQVLRIGIADARGAEADPFKISKEDLLGEEPDIGTYETDAWRELQGMIGLEDVKASMRSFINGTLLDFHREIDGYKPLRPGLCKLFLGPPGTGKTTVGKLFGKVLCGLGMLSSEDFVFKNATDFIGSFIGHSEKQTKDIIRGAKGKVLMIDEAYMLDPHRNKSAGGPDPFRQAVIDTIVGEVQNSPGEDLCVIMCGYKEPMERMLEKANPGLARRFPLADAFMFQEYSLEQLAQVLDLKLQAEGLKMTDDAKSVALDTLKLAKQQANFGNGGEVMNLLGRAMARYRTRFGEMTPEERTGIVCFQPVDIDPKQQHNPDIEKAIEEWFKELNEVTDSKTRFQSLARRAAAIRKTGRDPASSMPFHFMIKETQGADPVKIAKKIAWLYL
ncbi:P-loop containing nucleoside triphosphate hydrolase protein, partial [Viridothelium virens]